MLRAAASQGTRRAAMMGAVGISTAGGAYYAANSESTLGVRRQGQFWVRIFPIIADYYWNTASSSPYVRYQKWRQQDVVDEERVRQDKKEALQKRHARHAPEILQVMLDLKGLYIKLGQVLSVTALPIPEAYRALFRTLQSDVPGWEEFDQVVKPTLEQEFGKNLDDVFSFIDPVPSGAASIGQAHRATLKEAGEEVIVKVQYPDASWQVPADIKCVGDFLKLCVWAGVVDESAANMSFEEFARQFLAELDYEAERHNLQEVYNSSIQPNSPYMKRGVVVPKVFNDYCTKRVITMTYLPGPKLEEEARRQLEMLGIDTKKGVHSIVRDVTKEAPVTEERADGTEIKPLKHPVSANTSWTITISKLFTRVVGVDSILWAVRLGRRLLLWSTAAAVATVRFGSPVFPLDWVEWTKSHEMAAKQAERLALTESWIDALFDVHGHQIFVLGLFNADPHPGNILVVEDDERPSARLGLIDYGQCKRLTPEERVKVARLILNVANNASDEEVARSFRDLGIQTKNDSTEFLANFANIMFGRFKSEHLDPSWHRKLHSMDRVTYFPKELSMVYRTTLLLRGLAASLQINSSAGEHWRHHAQAAIDQYATEEANKAHLTVVEEMPHDEVMLGNPQLASS